MDEQQVGDKATTPQVEMLSESEARELIQGNREPLTLEELHRMASNIFRRSHRGALDVRRARALMALVDSLGGVIKQVEDRRAKAEELRVANEMNSRLERLERQPALSYGAQHAAAGVDAQQGGADDAGQPDDYPPEPQFSPSAPTIRYG